MAEMIPESINSIKTATTGEKKVFRLFQDALLPDEDNIVWFEPRCMERYTDFIVWSQKYGLLIIEVKDWIFNQITKYDPIMFEGNFYDNITKGHRNPLLTAKDAHNKIKDVIKKIPSLIHKDGQYAKQLKFPISFGVIYTNISRKDFANNGILNNQICGNNQVLFSEDIKFDYDDKEKRRELEIKLKLMSQSNVQFSFEPLSYEELKALRFAIFPEIRVNTEKIKRLHSQEDEEKMKALDLEQERTAKTLGEGHRILKGVAGSGKTLVLACRAKYLKQLNPNWKILVLCYNISLRKYLEKLIQYSGTNTKQYNEGITVTHFHALVKELSKVDLSKWVDESSEDYDKRVGLILQGKIAEGVIKKGIFDAILIDEGQDFVTEWMKGLSLLLNESTDSLLFCYDPAQNVFGKKKPVWKDAGFKVQGKKPSLLKKSYRNTIEILTIARNFGKMEANQIPIEDDTIDNKLFPELATDRHGEIPELIHLNNINLICERIIDEINILRSHQGISNMDIGILFNGTLYSFPEIFSRIYLSKSNLNDLYLIKSNDRDAKLNLDVSSNTIKVMPIESCKGLEFKIVFLVGIDEMPRSKRDQDAERSLVYVALTRAQDKLFIYFQNENEFIKELQQAITGFHVLE